MTLGKLYRRHTLEVNVGIEKISSEHPILIQSMLNTNTMDTEACMEQAIKIFDAGGKLIRITAQGVREAENLKNIKRGLEEKGYDFPISADIHFTPEAAKVAAKYVDKVRVNPGNFLDKKTKNISLYTEDEYQEELKRLHKGFKELIDICKSNHTAIRIGTNHGSLSNRITTRYGNTAQGMVEATMEYLRIAVSENFKDVVISLKSSDCMLMINAVRLLVVKMESENMAFPIHLGVTEAGEGEDGRIRSAIGIGALLNEGIGDTIRVSLTESPENEIPVARDIIMFSNPEYFAYKQTVAIDNHPSSIVADISGISDIALLEAMLDLKLLEGKYIMGDNSPKYVYASDLGDIVEYIPDGISIMMDIKYVQDLAQGNIIPIYSVNDYLSNRNDGFKKVVVEVNSLEEINNYFLFEINRHTDDIIMLSMGLNYHSCRKAAIMIRNKYILNKIIINADVAGLDIRTVNEFIVSVSMHTGAILGDKLCSGILIKSTPIFGLTHSMPLAKNILQSVGLKRYKTEFVSCPGCGRTMFKLEDAVSKVKEAFSHLKKLKIAVMGCIVNGPGEMGDADYGYVGGGGGKVNLYKKGRMIFSSIPEDEAIQVLEDIIKKSGDWEDK